MQGFLIKYFDADGMPGKVARSLPGLRVTLVGESHVLDVAVFCWARFPRNARGRVAEEWFEPPDIVVEIASPGQTITKLTRDCEWYLANGVPLVLLVLPVGERVRLFLPGQPWRELTGDDEIEFSPIIPGARLGARELFAALDAD